MSIIAQGINGVVKTVLTANTATAKEQIGTLRFELDGTNGMKVYKYILAGSDIAVGDVLANSGVTGVSMKVDTTNSSGKIPAQGVGIGTITNAYYGWVQVDGYHSAVKKPVTLTSSAGKVAFQLCGKAKNALNGATATAFNFVDNIVQLSSKACACTAVPCMVHLL